MNVVELFSGIGAQAKALEKLNIKHKVLATCDWDINAIIAYDIIHNGKQDISKYDNYSNLELYHMIKDYSLSGNGKKPMTLQAKRSLDITVKKKLLSAIDRSNNLIDISKLKGKDLPNDISIDLMTYSFPCQDLSLAGNWHHNSGGIDRDANNRSSLLWEVERILYERKKDNLAMPKSLLMENVTSILSSKHIDNFKEWQKSLNDLGYENLVMTLNELFGVPQMRKRTYMLSIYVGDNEEYKKEVLNIFSEYNENNLHDKFKIKKFDINDVLKDDYSNLIYKKEAEESNPNDTISRRDIYNKSELITRESTKVVPTVTTKQDRYPNSGVIDYKSSVKGRANFRYFTPRECFILMGFDESDYQALLDDDVCVRNGRSFFTRDKTNRMAGNSICVNVLEAIFLLDIKILSKNK